MNDQLSSRLVGHRVLFCSMSCCSESLQFQRDQTFLYDLVAQAVLVGMSTQLADQASCRLSKPKVCVSVLSSP